MVSKLVTGLSPLSQVLVVHLHALGGSGATGGTPAVLLCGECFQGIRRYLQLVKQGLDVVFETFLISYESSPYSISFGIRSSFILTTWPIQRSCLLASRVSMLQQSTLRSNSWVIRSFLLNPSMQRIHFMRQACRDLTWRTYIVHTLLP